MRKGKEAKAIRRKNAELLKKAREERSDEEQLALIKSRPGESKKETARLLKNK
jgi:hypothetical protein